MRAFLLALSFFLATLPLWATSSLTSEALSMEVMNAFTARFEELHPSVLASDRVVELKNNAPFEEIPELATAATYNMAKLETVIGRRVVPITYLDHYGDALVTRQLVFYADFYKPVLKTVRRIYRGEKLTTGDVRVERVLSYGKPRNHLDEPTQVLGNQAAYTLAKDAILLAHAIEIPPLIKARQSVDVIYKRGAVQLKMRATAQQNGRLGEVIRAKLQSGRKDVIKGEVIDDKTILLRGRY